MGKKYKIEEVIAILRENPKLKFSNGHVEIGRIDNNLTTFRNGCVYGYSMDKYIFENADINDWEFIPQPVTWQEAIEAWTDGKTISCHTSKNINIYNPSNSMFLLQDNNTVSVSSVEIITGVWYIEE